MKLYTMTYFYNNGDWGGCNDYAYGPFTSLKSARALFKPMLKKVLIEECRVAEANADDVIAELEPFFMKFNPKESCGKLFGVQFYHSNILNALLNSADRSFGIYETELNNVTSIAIKNQSLDSLRFRV